MGVELLSKPTRQKASHKPKKTAKVQHGFKFIDLFAGIGGTRIGFESAGGQCVFSSEWDVAAQKTYEANFGEVPAGDITKISTSDIPDFDVLLGGFPCQPFSSIGQRKGFEHKTQGTLFYDVARIIKDKRPKAFLLENVQGLLTHDKGRTLSTILEVLAELDYDVQYRLINAADFGVPQMRRRVYIVGIDRHINRIDPSTFVFPEGVPGKHVNIGDYVESGVEGYSISKKLQKNYLFKLNDGRPKVLTKDSEGPAKTLVASYHKIQRLTGTFVKDGPTGLRLLTENECKSLMGFPRNFKVPVSRTQMYRQFGNSVVIPVVSAIAVSLKPFVVNGAKR
jgi:DNA (cytosine-5)-methyltransferase 1